MTLSIIVSKVDDIDGIRRRNLIMAALQIAPTKTEDSFERICVQQSSTVGEASCGSSSGLGARAARLARTSARLGARTSGASPLASLRGLICFDVSIALTGNERGCEVRLRYSFPLPGSRVDVTTGRFFLRFLRSLLLFSCLYQFVHGKRTVMITVTLLLQSRK